MKKIHTVGVVNFTHYSGDKWRFTFGNFTLIVNPGSRNRAEKVARICNGSLTRSGSLDNLARANISTVCS